jgi:hypothetical protein
MSSGLSRCRTGGSLLMRACRSAHGAAADLDRAARNGSPAPLPAAEIDLVQTVPLELEHVMHSSVFGD